MPDDLTDDDFAALAAEAFRTLDHGDLRAELEASAEDEAAGRLRDAEDVFTDMEAKYNLPN